VTVQESPFTQWDMFLGLLGAVTGQIMFTRRHEQELSESTRAV
jgi:hypothetical protein